MRVYRNTQCGGISHPVAIGSGDQDTGSRIAALHSPRILRGWRCVVKGEPLALATPIALGAGRGLPLGAILSHAEESLCVGNSAVLLDVQRCVADHMARCGASRNRQKGAVNMYSLSEAAKASGKSKSTLTRAIDKGKISASKDEHGRYQIEPIELHRVYPAVAFEPVAQQADDQPRNGDATSEFLNELIELRAEAKTKEQLVIAHEKTIDDLRQRLDKEGEERRQIMARLTDMTAKLAEPAPKKGLFARVFG